MFCYNQMDEVIKKNKKKEEKENIGRGGVGEKAAMIKIELQMQLKLGELTDLSRPKYTTKKGTAPPKRCLYQAHANKIISTYTRKILHTPHQVFLNPNSWVPEIFVSININVKKQPSRHQRRVCGIILGLNNTDLIQAIIF